MLTAYPASGAASGSLDAQRLSWIDLLDPTEAERARVEARCGFRLPSRAQLSEVESSSRISEKDGVLYLSMPVVAHVNALDEAPSPVGFALSKDVLVTVRFGALRSFDSVAAKSEQGGLATGVEAFAAIIDEMVDLSADVLEEIGAELDAISRAVFPKLRAQRAHVTQSNEALREVLTDVGRAGERLSRARDTLLGLQRIVPFACGNDRDWIPAPVHARLRTAQSDLTSLIDYGSHLYGKIQFLLDATLGFISTRQNDIFQMLTVVSIVGIPPTLVASIYGMNFHDMPELSWRWGYPYGLAVIALSAILPFLYFRWRKWV